MKKRGHKKRRRKIKHHALSKKAFVIGISIFSGILLLSLLLAGRYLYKNPDSEDMDISDTGVSDMLQSDTESSDTKQAIKDRETGQTDKDTLQGDSSIVRGEIAENTEAGTGQSDDTESVETGSDTDGAIKLSIFGDSISTFDEWIPEGYYDFFPMNGNVADVEQTWWKMVLNDTGMRLCVNGSSSGSICAGYSPGADTPQEGCSEFRINGLADANGSSPDIIIVYMGTNDFLNDIPIGDNDGTRVVEEGNVENFSDAYCLILDKMHARYPAARIFCCNLLPVGDIWNGCVLITNGQGLGSDAYSRQIETIASAKGYSVIDLEHCGVTIENLAQYTGDGVHPNPEGMKLIRDAVEAVLTNQ